MTNKKKRGRPDIEELLARPWCYYCERDFDDLKILINHQKAKHFKCDRCNRRLNTAGGLSVHMNQVHKENLTAIDNALAGRTGLDHEIFGMEGVPEDVKQAHNRRVIEEFSQAERERQAATGNPAPGSGANVAKKPKIESTQSLKERLAAHKAAKLQQQENGDGSTGSNTPTSISAQPVPAAQPTQQPQAPGYAAYQAPYAVTQAQPTTYGHPATYNPIPPQPPFPQAGYPMQQPYGQTAAPPQQLPYGQSPPPFGQPYGQLPAVSYPTNQPYPAAISPPPFAGPVPQVGSPFQAQPPQNGLPHHVGRAHSGSPAPSHLQGRTHSPLNGAQQRPPSATLPGAPGLPQRPAVGAPPVNAAQFQQMHQGQIPATNTHTVPKMQQPGHANGQPQSQQVSGHAPAHEDPVGASSLDDLISSASKQADANAALSANASKAATPQPPAVSTHSKDDATEKKATASKDKDKDKSAKTTRLVYSDNDISPEEKMAQMPRYSFDRTKRTVAT